LTTILCRLAWECLAAYQKMGVFKGRASSRWRTAAAAAMGAAAAAAGGCVLCFMGMHVGAGVLHEG